LAVFFAPHEATDFRWNAEIPDGTFEPKIPDDYTEINLADFVPGKAGFAGLLYLIDEGNGGPPDCKVRSCARGRKLRGCWQCDDFPACEKLKFLEVHHGKAHLKNLRKLNTQGPAAFVKGKRYWYAPK